jgi:Peptidase_C39 like family
MTNIPIPFVSKRPYGPTPWVTFGSTKEEYEKWAGEICSIACCRSLILAKCGDAPSLWELTQQAIKMGVFLDEGTSIKGAFHKPLAQLLAMHDIVAQLFQKETEAAIWNLSERYPIIISIDLSKYTTSAGSHLVLITDIDLISEQYIVHDSASTLCNVGYDCRVSRSQLSKISNGRGLIIKTRF